MYTRPLQKQHKTVIPILRALLSVNFTVFLFEFALNSILQNRNV